MSLANCVGQDERDPEDTRPAVRSLPERRDDHRPPDCPQCDDVDHRQLPLNLPRMHHRAVPAHMSQPAPRLASEAIADTNGDGNGEGGRLAERAWMADARVVRVVMRHHESVARATERAYLDLHRLGVPEPAGLLLGDPLDLKRAVEAAVRRRIRTG